MAKPPRNQPRKPHDMGGDPAGPVDHHEHVPTLTERRIDAMMLLLRAKPRAYWVTDENRRTIESLTPDTYQAAKYYEKWAYGMRSLLVEKGVLTEDEIATKLAEVKKRFKPATGKGGRAAKATAKSQAASKKPAAKVKSTVKRKAEGAA